MQFIFPDPPPKDFPEIGSKKTVKCFHWWPIVVQEADCKKLLWLETASIEYTYLHSPKWDELCAGKWKPTRIVERC